MINAELKAAAAPKAGLRRFLPLAVLAAGFALFFALGLERHISLAALRAHREAAAHWVGLHRILAALGFCVLYILVVAATIPVATVLTLAAGLLFGAWEGGALVVVSATLGAAIVFVATRTALAGLIEARAGARLHAMEEGFRDNAFNYLLALRLAPVFPFFLVNVAAGLLGVRLSTFALATFIGIIPGTFIYAGLGHGLAAAFASGSAPDLALVFRPAVLPLLGLALLSLLPVLRRRKKR